MLQALCCSCSHAAHSHHWHLGYVCTKCRSASSLRCFSAHVRCSRRRAVLQSMKARAACMTMLARDGQQLRRHGAQLPSPLHCSVVARCHETLTKRCPVDAAFFSRFSRDRIASKTAPRCKTRCTRTRRAAPDLLLPSCSPAASSCAHNTCMSVRLCSSCRRIVSTVCGRARAVRPLWMQRDCNSPSLTDCAD